MEKELLFTNTLSMRYAAEADGFGYWMVVTTSDGEQHIRTLCEPPLPYQQMFCRDLGAGLNRHLHHNGAWIVGLVEAKPLLVIDEAGAGRDYERAILLWVDEDGDPQFTIEVEDDWSRILSVGPDHWINKAEEAWLRWRHMREVLDPQEGETYKRAQGQKPPSLPN